jgi:hypothetical protein
MNSPNELHYVVLPTRVGRVLVLMSCDGVVDVVLDSPGAPSGDPLSLMSSRFPYTRLMPGDGTHRAWAAAVVAHIDGRHVDVGAPVDLTWSPSFVRAPVSAGVGSELGRAC